MPRPCREPPQPNREPQETHRPISSRVNPGAVDHAIAAILAAFKTGGRGPDETDDGGDRGGGNADPDARPFTPEELAKARRVPRVRTLRRALGLTQEEFAARYRIPLGTLRDWEQGRSEPDQPVRAYLTVIAHDPEGMRKALTSSGTS